MAILLKDQIKEITREHLNNYGGVAMGQCLTAVGWVGGTLPELYEEDGMVELSMADVAGGGIAVGAALAGARPMYVIRYQGFNWFNAPMIVNYAAKSREIWGRPCPIMVRSIAMEGGIGPVAGSSHHSLYYRMPGTNIVSPMTPGEYRDAYKWFMEHNEVLYVSEHRGSYSNSEELLDTVVENTKVVLFPISITRFAAVEAAKILNDQGIPTSVIHLPWIKPLMIRTSSWVDTLFEADMGLVLDDDYADGIAACLAHKFTNRSFENEGREGPTPVYSLGIKDRSAGFSKETDNLPPTADDIVKEVFHRWQR